MAIIYTGSCLGFQSFGSSSFVITGVTPALIDDEGGTPMVATGTFPANVPLQLFLGSSGTSNDPPCYGGQGYGYSPMSLDSTTLNFISPPGTKGLVTLTIQYGSITGFFYPIAMVERNWKSKNFSIRACFPPWMDVGSRRLEEEPRR